MRCGRAQYVIGGIQSEPKGVSSHGRGRALLGRPGVPPLERSPLRRPRRDADAVRQGPQVRGAGTSTRAGRYATDCQSSRSSPSVRSGATYRRRSEGVEPAGSPLARADWLLRKISFDEQYLFSLRWRERAQKGKGSERGPGHRGPSSLRGRTRRPPAASAPVNRPGPGGLAAGFALAAACALALRKSGCVGPEALPVSTVSRKEPDTQERRGKAAGTERAIAAGA